MGWILAAISVVVTLWLSTLIGPLPTLGLWAVVCVLCSLGSKLANRLWNPDDAYNIEHYGKRRH